MPTVAETERIAALVERLLPLAARRRGELIAAEDWNTVVGALLEVARAVLTDPDDDVPPHVHADQVSPGWLDPTLRARIERGVLGDPAAAARLAAVERRTSALQGRIEDVGGDVRAVRGVTARLEAADLARESGLTRVARRVDGLGDARDAVAEVRGTLAALQQDLDRVTTLARDLEVDGEPVSGRDLVGRIEALEDLRARLTGPDGTELDATRFALRLAELEEALVTEEELDEALAGVGRAGLSDADRDAVLTDARAAAREQVDASTGDLAERLRADIGQRLDEVSERAVATAATRAEEVTTALGDRLRDDLLDAVREGDEAVRAALDEVAGAVREDVRADVDARLATSAESLGARVEEGLGAARAALEQRLAESIGALRAEVEPLTGRLDDVERSVADARAATDQASRELRAALQAVEASLGDRLEASSRDLRASLRAADAQVQQALRAELAAERQRVDQAITALRTSLPDQLREEVRAQVDRAVVREVDTSVRRQLIASGITPGRQPITPVDPNRPIGPG